MLEAKTNLSKLVGRIVTDSAIHSLSRTKKLLLAFIAAAVVLCPVALGLVSAPPSIAQSETDSHERLSFDVASVKPSAPNTPYSLSILPGGHLIWLHTNIALMIKWAYELRDGQLIGGPAWLYTKGFDTNAKCDPPVGGDPHNMTAEQRDEYRQQMLLRLQSLLVDRFQLKLRQETRDMPVLDLIIAKNGPKFQESPKPGPDGKVKEGAIVRRGGHVEIYHEPMDLVARALSQVSGQTVVDRTGLTGRYDLKLDWTPDSTAPLTPANNTANAADPSGPSLFTAVQEQLGLKLKAAKEPVPVFVVERAALPEPN